ncbi:two-component system, NarL family, sensor histidine kinase ComP [Thermoflexales bacterium]|nr:two-component system, NarL family, sensor histidine kinase ComP [Thermoflexales bacterium]
MQSLPVPEPNEEQIRLHTQLLNAVEQAILAVDLTGRIIFWNRFAERLYGWTEDEVHGRNIVEVLAAPLLMESARANMGPLRRGEGWSGEFLVQRRDGTTFIAHVSATLIQDDTTTLISIVARSRDSTAQQQLLEANRLLAEASARLASAVDYETQLTTLAQLAVPQLADWCAVHLLQADGSLEQVAVASVGTGTPPAAHDWLQNYLTLDDVDGLPAVLRNGEPKLFSDVAANQQAAAAAIKSYMIVPLIARPQTLGAITFVTAESGRRLDLNALALAENLVSHIAVYLDKARLYRESQRLNAELEQRVSERTTELRTAIAQLQQSEVTIQTLFRISKKLNATLEVDTILDELAQEAIRLVNGESGFAGLRTANGMTVRKYFRQGVALPFEYTWPPGVGIPGWVLEHKVPYGTSDAAHDPVMQHELSINTDIRSLICTPILSSFGEVLGYFDLRNKQDAEGFTIADQEMLMALAPAASIAIQNALAYQRRLSAEAELQEAYERLRALAANLELVREEERTQIARELHDQLGQALTAMKFDLAWLTDRLVQKDATLAQKAKAITTQMDTMIKTVRRIATELRPGMLDDLGLAASLEWLARDFEKRTGIGCEVRAHSPDLILPRAPSLALFRIFQEALTNVARHASARLIEVSLTASPEALILEVHDDGRGIQASEIAGLHSLGLLGMRERAQRLGGTFEIQGVPGDGTIVTVSIPLKPNE